MRSTITLLDIDRKYLNNIFSKSLEIVRTNKRSVILVRDMATILHWFPKPRSYLKICVTHLREIAKMEGVNRISREALYYLRNYLEAYKV